VTKHKIQTAKSTHKEGDLVVVENMYEVGLVVEGPFVSPNSGAEYVGVMMVDDGDNLVLKVPVHRCHRVSRPVGSPLPSASFVGPFTQRNGPKLEKFSSENFQNLLTLTIDEEEQ